MDFIEKKEKFASLIEEFISNPEKESELMAMINEFSNDEDFKGKELFTNMFGELSRYLPELSRKELKQRVLMIRGFVE